MKKGFIFIFFILFTSVLFSLDFNLSSHTKMEMNCGFDNNKYIGGNINRAPDFFINEDLNLEVFPVSKINVVSDFKFFGRFSQNDFKFNFGVNELFINFQGRKNRFFVGKKKYNLNYSNLFSLMDKFQSGFSGTGAVFPFIAYLDFINIVYLKDDNGKIGFEDIHTLLGSNFKIWNFNIGIYTDMLHIFDFPSSMFGNLFTNWNGFCNDLQVYKENFEVVTYFNGSVKLGYFTLYEELALFGVRKHYAVKNVQKIENESENKNILVENREKNCFIDGNLGVVFDNSIFKVIFEYCYKMNGYGPEELSSINEYLIGNSGDLNKIYNEKNGVFKNNIGLSIAYTIVPDLTITLSDIFTFPEYGCGPEYLGNLISSEIRYKFKGRLNIYNSLDVGFGGEKSEFVLYTKHPINVKFGVEIIF